MTATTTVETGAPSAGARSGARGPRDWAATEEQQLPTYEEAIRRLGIGAGQRVLEVGCGRASSSRLRPIAAREAYGSTPPRRWSHSPGRACPRRT